MRVTLKITGTQVREPIIFILSCERVRERDPLMRVTLKITGTQVREPIILILSCERVRERDPLMRVQRCKKITILDINSQYYRWCSAEKTA